MMIRQLLLILLVGQALFTIPLQAEDRGTHPIEQHAGEEFITKGPYRSINESGIEVFEKEPYLIILTDEDKTFTIISMEEIWEVLKIIERRFYRLPYMTDEYCDELCQAKREVVRIEWEQKEDAKIKSLIHKFREVMK